MADILVVEDEPGIAELIALNLRHEGHDARLAEDAVTAVDALNQSLPDLVILDWMLPGESGVSLLRRWRTDPRTQALCVILLTARSEDADLVVGLDAGADDYLTKPFSTVELMARIRAVLRRKRPEAANTIVELGALRLDPSTRRTFGGEVEVSLGPTEFKLLRFFMTHPERVHTRAQLLDRVWGDHVFIEERTVDVHIKRLRSALEPTGCAGLIETVRGAGYRMSHTPYVGA